MTDIIFAAPISIRRPRLAVAQFVKCWVGLPIVSVATAVGNAFAMAYVAPYQPGQKSQPISRDDTQGRDPNW